MSPELIERDSLIDPPSNTPIAEPESDSDPGSPASPTGVGSPGTPTRNDLLLLIAEERARLAALDCQRDEIRDRLEVLRAQLVEASTLLPPRVVQRSLRTSRGTPNTASEKVRLFRSLFRGREEIFPTRFMSKRTGRPGYAPACSNKFVRGICGLPVVKCGDCPNQAFLPVDDQAILDHLRGHHVMGVYPLLRDETCWFLAVDFDRAAWKDDVLSFVETCRSLHVPVAVERSRSGDGAHVWFFFASAITAGVARRMGSYLITETMSRRHQLSMESYDRLFPNQDTMPRKGFGNLIALPPQYDARKHGNTVFLDDDLEPRADQWAYLASAPRIEASVVEAIAAEATRRGQVIGLRLADAPDDEHTTPWTRPPSRTALVRISGPLPKQVHAVLAQRLFIDKEGLPSPLLNQIKRIAAFQNPEFYKKQMMRLSTALTPRVVACAEEFPQHIALPRGCHGEVEKLLDDHGVNLVVDDQRHEGRSLDVRFEGELTSIQEQAATALMQHDIGVFVAPPGLGKTVLGTHLVARRRRSTLVLVHRRPLLDQWVAQLAMLLGIDEKTVGQVGGGNAARTGCSTWR